MVAPSIVITHVGSKDSNKVAIVSSKRCGLHSMIRRMGSQELKETIMTD